ncbi:hypothetical protein T492DRAFT_1036137 [Pavlovales sp. CCMP2436]|nr:hypothetical protein T492DRAFT_1036137 [Pavlovales sp. CCMP2436]
MRVLTIRLSDRSERTIGTFPTRLHSDIRTVILGLRRGMRQKGRPVTLDGSRTAAVEEALRDFSQLGSIEGLREAITRWTQELLVASAAGLNSYYDAARTELYTQHNAIAQTALSKRVWQLQPELPTVCADLLLDVGCGSGLSSAIFEKVAPLSNRVIGCDLSMAMIAHARRVGAAFDVVQADISLPLPFRDASFASALSVSTVQHLLQPGADGRSASERLAVLFSSLKRTVMPGRAVSRCISVQFHVDSAADAQTIREACLAQGIECGLLMDQPYGSDSRRWFLTSRAAAEPTAAAAARPPRLCKLYCDSSDGCATCVLEQHAAMTFSASTLPTEHLEWVTGEHLRAAHRWVRVLRRQRREVGASPGLDVAGQAAVAGKAGEEEAMAGVAGKALVAGKAEIAGNEDGKAKRAGHAAPPARSGKPEWQLTETQADVAANLIALLGEDCDLTQLKASAAEVLELLHRD